MIRLPHWDPRRKLYKARASAHKWLLVTSFGYLGYKNARFGRIEAHEAVTTYSREALLRAKEAAEDMGYTVLHMYVDGLWVVRPNETLTSQTVQPLMDEIEARTGLPIALEGVYKWVAFLPSRQDERIPVANRYFGVFQDGTLKTRGIEARRRDTPAWVAKVQMECLERLAQEPGPQAAIEALPEIMRQLRRRLRDLAGGRLAPQELLVAQKLSRELAEYRSPSPAARAAVQLEQIGKPLRPGQMVRFVHTLGKPGVHAWDLDEPLDPARIDLDRYARLLLRAAVTVLQPFGVRPDDLRRWLFYTQGNKLPARPYAVQLRLPGVFPTISKRPTLNDRLEEEPLCLPVTLNTA